MSNRCYIEVRFYGNFIKWQYHVEENGFAAQFADSQLDETIIYNHSNTILLMFGLE